MKADMPGRESLDIHASEDGTIIIGQGWEDRTNSYKDNIEILPQDVPLFINKIQEALRKIEGQNNE